MRCLIVLCFVAAVCAQYDYQPTVQSGEAVLSNSIPASGSAPASSESSHDSVALAPQSGVDKEFYIFSADDNDFNDNEGQQAASSLKQNLRVVFIKSPDNRGVEDAALALAKQAGEQQTAIYVLKKQTDISDLANKLNNINQSGNNKPEVHFVKYRTPEDAVNAQKAIQDQYDGLGGSSKTVDGGVAPVLNFASSAPVASNHQNSGVSHEGPSNSYNPTAASDEAAASNSYTAPASAAVEEPSYNFIAPAAAPGLSYFAPIPASASTNTNNVATESVASAPLNSYSPNASGALNSYLPPAAQVDTAPSAPAQISAPVNSYIPPASNAEVPTTSYIAPANVAEDLNTSYLPASILRLFRL